jgi:hypothetical protein
MSATKKGEFNFVWIFALIAGGAILLLAILGIGKLGDTKDLERNTLGAKEIEILLQPLQAGIADNSYATITFKEETRTRIDCFEDETFGRNEITMNTKSPIDETWTQNAAPIKTTNTYIYSSGNNQGKKLHVLSQPFSLPYEIADITIITNKEYCFYGTPEEIEETIEGIGTNNIEIVKEGTCNLTTTEHICFGAAGGNKCTQRIIGTNGNYKSGTISTANYERTYTEELLLPAIIAEEESWECNTKRLLYKGSLLAEGYKKKIEQMNRRGCTSNLEGPLTTWKEVLNIGTTNNLPTIKENAKTLQQQETKELCGVW